jgi:hypothetical protein
MGATDSIHGCNVLAPDPSVRTGSVKNKTATLREPQLPLVGAARSARGAETFEAAWAHVLNVLRGKVGRWAVETWLVDSTAEISGSAVVVRGRNPEATRYVQKHYGPEIVATLERLHTGLAVRFDEAAGTTAAAAARRRA